MSSIDVVTHLNSTVSRSESKMKTSLALASTLATAALGAIEPKNFIFVIPDGLAPASVTLARTYLSMAEGGSTPGAPGTVSKIAIDMTVRVRGGG